MTTTKEKYDSFDNLKKQIIKNRELNNHSQKYKNITPAIGGIAAGSLNVIGTALNSGKAGMSVAVNSNTLSPPESMSVPGDLEVGQTVNISGDLKVHGHIQADEMTIDVRKIILNMDYGYIEEVIGKVEKHQLNQLLSHLGDLRLMIEKELFKRS